MRLKEKVAIITGAKSGIGLATAIRFADEGAKFVVADIRDTHQEVGEITRGGAEAIFVRVDVSDESQVINLIEKTVATYGRLDILVNNAGIQLAKKISDTTEAEWDRLMNINLKGVFLCSKAAIPVMRRNGEGVIVNVSSELGVVGGSEIAAYSASKGGVVQLTKSMAMTMPRMEFESIVSRQVQSQHHCWRQSLRRLQTPRKRDTVL
jgi:NAD(P)-dependent dehydrogenase (short-subunit alcohol dehydrogenase family)